MAAIIRRCLDVVVVSVVFDYLETRCLVAIDDIIAIIFLTFSEIEIKIIQQMCFRYDSAGLCCTHTKMRIKFTIQQYHFIHLAKIFIVDWGNISFKKAVTFAK